MSLKIKVYLDYICPFCIIAMKSFCDVIKNKNIEVELIPFEICKVGEEKLNPLEDEDVANLWREEIFPASKKLNMNLNIPTIIPHPYTNLAFQGFYFAKQYNKEKEYSKRVYIAFFYENQDIEKVDVIARLAGEVGLDKYQCLQKLEEGKYKEMQDYYIKEAEDDKIEIVPTFTIGDSRLEGLISKEEFEKVIENEIKKS